MWPFFLCLLTLCFDCFLCSSFSVFCTLGSYAGRAKIEGATLTIHSVTQKDSGEYRCEVTASEDHVNLGEATVTLNVLGMNILRTYIRIGIGQICVSGEH